MQRKRLLLLVLALALFFLVALWFAFYRAPKNPPPLTLYGNVDVRLVDIGFRVPGQVALLHFEEGDLVKKGQLLASLDKSPYDSKIKEAEASLAATRVNLTNALKLWERRKELIVSGGVSQEDLDNAFTSKEALKEQLKEREAALAIAYDNYRYTDALAPTEGVILSRIKEPGSVVGPTDAIYSLSVSSPVWIRAFIPEPELARVTYGMKALIETDGGHAYSGTVGFISPVAEFTPKTVETTELRTDLVYRLRIYADNPDHYLKQGMPVTVILDARRD